MDLNLLFKSSDHIRYQDGIHISGPHGGAKCAVKVEPNISGCSGYKVVSDDGYIVAICNLDGMHPVRQNNVQMAPKSMRVISQSDNKIVLRGYPLQAMSSFGWIDFDGQNYGLTIFLKNEQVEKCVLHMYDRNIEIKYLR